MIDEVASDAMNLGGKRQVGISSSLSSSSAASASASSTSSARVHDPLENDNDNLASMSCRAWWQVTKELEDTSPNANGERGTVHIPAMSEGELYAEYRADHITANEGLSLAPVDQSTWKKIWKEEFPGISIVQRQRVSTA